MPPRKRTLSERVEDLERHDRSTDDQLRRMGNNVHELETESGWDFPWEGLGFLVVALAALAVLTLGLWWGVDSAHTNSVKDQKIHIERVRACRSADNVDACLARLK